MRKDNSFFESIIIEMICTKKSIREMAKKYNIPKSTLHYKICAVKQFLDKETYLKFEELLKNNKIEMASKGGKCIKGKPRKRRLKDD